MSSAGWKDIKYKQDLPPPGGYGSVPYKRNLPLRGPSGWTLGALVLAIHGFAYYKLNTEMVYFNLTRKENAEAEFAYVPLLEAEKDRAHLLLHKENIESEALNIVGTGYDPDYKPGQFDSFHVQRYEEPLVGGTSLFFHQVREWYGNRAWIPIIGP